MKWIKDRLPYSTGMYAIRMVPTNELKSFTFGYFDGYGWKLPSETGDLSPYRGRPEWSVIDWGIDHDAHNLIERTS